MTQIITKAPSVKGIQYILNGKVVRVTKKEYLFAVICSTGVLGFTSTIKTAQSLFNFWQKNGNDSIKDVQILNIL